MGLMFEKSRISVCAGGISCDEQQWSG